MKRCLALLLLLPATLVPTTAESATSSSASTPAPAAAPAHTLTISGPGVTTYPDFSPDIERYGITTTDASTGTVQVNATTSDPGGKVYIDGRLAPNGKRTVTGLEPNDEVSVIFEDSAGRATHSAIYLPAGLHGLKRTGNGPAPTEHTLLTLGLWGAGTPFFEIAVDDNGVPATVHTETTSAMDFKRQPNGQLSVSRASATSDDKEGSAVVALDEDLSEISRHETVGLVNTDPHDSILLPDGSHYFVSYEPDAQTGLTDAVIQHVGSDGEVLFQWNSRDHVDPATETVIGEGNPDYAHINSIQVMDDGDILASFRHFSAVFKIARTAHDGFEQGDVVWRLGGRFSDFTFPDDEYGGPCAQHTAAQIANGHVVLYDNGSWDFNGAHPLCIDPEDRTGDTVARNFTRITEYALDENSGEAHLVWEFDHERRFAIFAGSAERLDNGNTLVGWASARDAVVTEVTPDKKIAWELSDPNPSDQRQFTYRAARTTIEDVTDPAVTLPVADGAEFHRGQTVRPAFGCTDRGGSSLAACTTTGIVEDRLDTSRVGTHTVSITATDGAGNTTTDSRSYVVVADQPDAMIRARTSKKFVGDDVYGPAARQKITRQLKRAGQTSVAVVRIQNDGSLRDRMRIKGVKGTKKFRVAYLVGGKKVTGRVVAGTYRTPAVAPGQHWVMRVKVTRTTQAKKGNQRTVRVRATAGHNPKHDNVAVVVRAR